MIINGFPVGDYRVTDVGGKKTLIFSCKDCVYASSLADDARCRYHVMKALQESAADMIVFSEVYERVYSAEQTQMLSQIALMVKRFETETPWSFDEKLGIKPAGEKEFGERHAFLLRIAYDLPLYDPALAYIELLQALKNEGERFNNSTNAEQKADLGAYLQTLLNVKTEFEKTIFIQKVREMLSKGSNVEDTTQFYKLFFQAQIKPSFIGSRLEFSDNEQLELLADYPVFRKDDSLGEKRELGRVQIFKHPNKPTRLYVVNPPEYSLPYDQYSIWSQTRERMSKYKPGRTTFSSISKNRDYFERVYKSTIQQLARENNVKLSNQETNDLSEVVARYTVGYGILELLLSDRDDWKNEEDIDTGSITDVYLDAPIGGRPIYIDHSRFGRCQTNIYYTESEADSLISKLRAMSGRPFDESHPVLDYDLADFQTRIAVIGKPLSPDGPAFAFRLHKSTPWTLPQLVEKKSMTPLCAGLLSFFMDQKLTLLVTGSRGSGKTSLMQALMLEITQNTRTLVLEDTLEIPIPYMKDIGFDIQSLKTRSPISVSKTETEVAPEEALRTALRLGDSAIVMGEVRSLEAKVLYEAMRIGAAGNIIMGTIHGDDAYSVWDRVVNDLQVPNTSFKATDIVVTAKPIRFGGSLQQVRRVTQVTEVKKHWMNDPQSEGGFLDLMLYDAHKDSIDLMEDNLKESDLFNKISRLSGLSMQDMWNQIRANASAKEFLVQLKKEAAQQSKDPKHNPLGKLLEAENTVIAHNKYLLLRQEQIEQFGSVDYDELLGEWKNWCRNSFAKRVAARK